MRYLSIDISISYRIVKYRRRFLFTTKILFKEEFNLLKNITIYIFYIGTKSPTYHQDNIIDY